MIDQLFWKRLYPNDFNAMHGRAQMAGSGGGARHITLGKNQARFPIEDFLGVGEETEKTIGTEPTPPSTEKFNVRFSEDKARNSEWQLMDQVGNRHPAWTLENGFPTIYDPGNRPFIVIIRLDDRYHVRLVMERDLPGLPDALSDIVANQPKGITDFDPGWSSAFGVVPDETNLGRYKAMASKAEEETRDEFAPEDLEDGRTRILAEVVLRQGQQSFRKTVLEAYGGACAITGCRVEVTLHAAHITPYRGPDTNHVSNGLLLRADVHTLFDLGLIAIDPNTHELRVSSLLADSEYCELDGRQIRLPALSHQRPSQAALRDHMMTFQA